MNQKHRDFVAAPLGDKPVTTLPGIGDVQGNTLEGQGFDKAHKIVAQFLLMNKDTEKFSVWLKNISGLNDQQAGTCAECVKEWCKKNNV